MLVGFSGYSLRFSAGLWVKGVRERMTVWDFLRVAKEVGADGVTLDPLFFPDPKEESLERVAEEARNLGLFVELEAGGTDPGYLRRAIDATVLLGSSVLRTFIGGGSDRYRLGPDGWRRRLQEAQDQLRGVIPYAREKDVRIAIENHCDLRADELLELIESLDPGWIGVCLDTGNSLSLLEDPLEAAEKLAPFTFSTHIKEYRASFCPEGMIAEGCALFDGDIPNREIVAMLRERSPLGEELHLNLEVPFERMVIPIFDRRYLEGLGERSALQVMRVLRYAKGRWVEGIEELTYSEEILRLEMERLRTSVERAKEEWG
jgi:sugar phosphate isomerase/epimerase